MSFFKKLVGRSRADDKEVGSSATGRPVPKDPMSPARVKATNFVPETAQISVAAAKARPAGAPIPEEPPEMSPEAHDASGLLEDDDEDMSVQSSFAQEPLRVTSSFQKDEVASSFKKDEVASSFKRDEVGYSFAKTNSWMSDTGMVDYGAPHVSGKAGVPAADVTSSWRSDVTDFDALYPGQATYNPAGPPSGMPPGFCPAGAGQSGMPQMQMPAGYPSPCGWQSPWPGFSPMMEWDPASLAAGGGMPPVGFPPQAGQLSAEEIDAYAEKMMVTARMMQAAAAAQRQQTSKAGSSSGGAAPARRGGPATTGGSVSSSAPAASPMESNVEVSQRTTVMLRNIPNDYSRDMLLALLEEEGFRSSYDFVYLPQDFKRRAGLGYSFINLINHDEAERFMTHFSGFNNWKFSSQKVCEAAWGAPLQGLDQHIDRYKNSPLMHPDVPDEFKPCLFKDGVRITFPDPTKRIRPPRMKLGASGSAGGAGLEAALEGDEV